MEQLFFGDLAPWFSIPALLGTGFFTIRIVLMFFTGGDMDLHIEDGTDVDFDHGDSEAAFKVLSVQAISAFLMGFGWGGLGAYRGWGLPAIASAPVGFLFGSGMMWILGKLLWIISRMQTSGTIDISAALLQEGKVYTAIPSKGTGRGVVRVVVDDRLRYYNAESEGESIESQTKVRVTNVDQETNTVTVTKVEGS